jgi:hypothetical protein
MLGAAAERRLTHHEVQKVAGIYDPMPASSTYPVHIAVHVRGEAEAFGPSLWTLATQVDPTLRLGSILLVDEVDDAILQFNEVAAMLTPTPEVPLPGPTAHPCDAGAG